jgi:hypothetical protein
MLMHPKYPLSILDLVAADVLHLNDLCLHANPGFPKHHSPVTVYCAATSYCVGNIQKWKTVLSLKALKPKSKYPLHPGNLLLVEVDV